MQSILIGIDPGTNELGMSVFQIEDETLILKDAFTLIVNKSFRVNKLIEERHGFRFARLDGFYKQITQRFEMYKPDHVACESPFYNPRRPAAFAPLVEMLYLIQKCVYDHRPDAGFSRHDPSSVKKAVGTHANSGEKLDMKASVARLWPTLNTKVDLETLDQHAIDAIAVGYAAYHKST